MPNFKTKGDNNTAIDREMVKPEQIKGKIVRVVPKLGWPTLLLKQKRESIPEDVVF